MVWLRQRSFKRREYKYLKKKDLFDTVMMMPTFRQHETGYRCMRVKGGRLNRNTDKYEYTRLSRRCDSVQFSAALKNRENRMTIDSDFPFFRHYFSPRHDLILWLRYNSGCSIEFKIIPITKKIDKILREE